VSEGRGLGEERLGGWLAEEREESGGAGQNPTDDGAPVLGRATGNVDSGRWSSAPMARAWTRGEWGDTGMGRRPTLLKSSLVAWSQKEKGKGGPVGASAWRREKEERGAWHCSGQLGAGAMAPNS
jgi:hypothetical protein